VIELLEGVVFAVGGYKQTLYRIDVAVYGRPDSKVFGIVHHCSLSVVSRKEQ
jgi:hypothetical protein